MDLYHLFVTYFTSGGALMYPLFGVSVVAWYLSVEKMGTLKQFEKSRKKYLKRVKEIHLGATEIEIKSTKNDSYDLLLESVNSVRRGKSVGSGEILFTEFLIAAIPSLKSRLSTISSWTSVAPLLGLLGTVMGMITTFKIITDFGLGNPNLMAQGISIALLTTQAGLTVAFPMVIVHNHLANKANHLIDQIKLDGEELVNDMASWNEGVKNV